MNLSKKHLQAMGDHLRKTVPSLEDADLRLTDLTDLLHVRVNLAGRECVYSIDTDCFAAVPDIIKALGVACIPLLRRWVKLVVADQMPYPESRISGGEVYATIVLATLADAEEPQGLDYYGLLLVDDEPQGPSVAKTVGRRARAKKAKAAQ